MASFVCLDNGTLSITVDYPPARTNRFRGRGKPTTVHRGLTGNAIVIERQVTAPTQPMGLWFNDLTLAQAETLATMRETGGLVTVRLYTGASAFQAMFAPAAEQTEEPFIGEDHPDKDEDGNNLDPALTTYTAEITLIPI